MTRTIAHDVDGQAGLIQKISEPTNLLAMEISRGAGRLADAISEQNRISALKRVRDRGSCREPRLGCDSSVTDLIAAIRRQREQIDDIDSRNTERGARLLHAAERATAVCFAGRVGEYRDESS